MNLRDIKFSSRARIPLALALPLGRRAEAKREAEQSEAERVKREAAEQTTVCQFCI